MIGHDTFVRSRCVNSSRCREIWRDGGDKGGRDNSGAGSDIDIWRESHDAGGDARSSGAPLAAGSARAKEKDDHMLSMLSCTL